MLAKIYLGLKTSNTEKVHDIETLKDFFKKNVKKMGLCLTITPTTFIYNNGRETGAIISLINYSIFPETRETIKQTTEEIANLCGEHYKKDKIAIEYQNQTLMLE